MTFEHQRIAAWKGGDLLPHVVDRLARESPEAVYGLWPALPNSYDAGYRSISYGQLANVVNGLAWWLREQLGPGHHGEAVAFMGPNDVRVTALLLAAVKVGYTVSSRG
jgi:acyl-coenzyme A synthetase/AMP-(fatty) acid ligase